ncbi:MAG: ABC transporter ATP-binding protein/permease, partial [Puniceicoccales bacterium]|jgi:ABC-type multidrug transport system fused ATPase/permease subunit|nr:ABC transporter ATP-binding protein/permease [Puniceicoccales bacterium]
MQTIWRVSAYFRKHRALFALTLALASVMTLASLSIPAVVREVLQRVGKLTTAGSAGDAAGAAAQAPNAAITLFIAGAGAILGLQFLRELLNCLRIRVNNIAEQKILIDIRRDLHRRLLELPESFYNKNKSGEIASRVIDDVANVERALLDGTEQGLAAVLTMLGVLVVLFWLNAPLAAVVCAPLPVLAAIGIWYNSRMSRRWRGVREAAAEMNALLVEDIQGNKLVQSFALQERERRRFAERAETLAQRTLRAMFQWSLYSPGTSFLAHCGVAAVFVAGGWLLVNSAGTAGSAGAAAAAGTGAAGDAFGFPDLFAFYMYAVLLYEPLSRMSALNQLLAAGKASGKRVFEVLDHPLEITSPATPAPFPAGVVGAEFRDVTFGYDGARGDILRHFTLTLPAGKVTALVGHTGAGKSTVAALLMRAYDPREGAVLFTAGDEKNAAGDAGTAGAAVDARALDLSTLRQRVGHVAQDPFLFDGTVEDNLRLAAEHATGDELRAALEAAAAWDFVAALPDGIRTQIGEKGVRLSQGEKQRLTIARVLLKNPPVVILDEATASVDTLTERQIQRALDSLRRDRTVLVIAHRLSTVRRADNIVVLDHGAVLEQGAHADLLANPASHYAHLWNAQTEAV